MTTEQWLKEKVDAYKENPTEALEEMLQITTDVIDQYKKSPYKAQKGLLGSCLAHNKLFLSAINKIQSIK